MENLFLNKMNAYRIYFRENIRKRECLRKFIIYYLISFDFSNEKLFL